MDSYIHAHFRMNKSIRFIASCAFLLWFLPAIHVEGQGSYSPPVTVNNATQTPVEGVGHDYLHDLNEVVNPQNGQLSIRIAGPNTRERGLNFPKFAFMYDTSGRFAMGGQLSVDNCTSQGVSAPGCDARVDAPVWANMSSVFPTNGTVLGQDRIFHNEQTTLSINLGEYNGGTQTCSFVGPDMYEDPEGGLHPLTYLSNVSGANCGSTFGISSGGFSNDTHYKLINDGLVSDTHGNIFHGDGLQTAEDTNGNSRNGTGRPWSVTTTTISNPSISYGGTGIVPSTVTLPGIANPSTNQAVSYTYQYSSFARDASPGLTMSVNTMGSTSNCYVDWTLRPLSSTFTDVSTLELPNGQSYNFGYETQWGLLNSITYPTGAKVTYTWEVNPLSEVAVVLTPSYYQSELPATGVNGVPTCYFEQDMPVVQSRVVSYDGTNNAVEQDFTYSTTWGNSGFWTKKQTTVTTTDLIRPGKPKTVTIYNYVPFSTYSPLTAVPSVSVMPVEDTIVYQDGSGNTLHTIKKVWNNVNLLSAECDILNNGFVSGKFYQYENVPNYATMDVPTDVSEYDYGQGVSSSCTQPTTSPARETKTQYASLPSSTLWSATGSSGGAIPQMNDRPYVIQVYDHGNLISETDSYYDQTSVAAVSSPPAYGHDETNYGPNQVTGRGNATTITRKCLQNCQNATTTAQYDETGQIVAVTSPDGNASGANPANYTTNLYYADAYSGGGSPPAGYSTNTNLTKIVRPSANGISHTSSFEYNYMLGELTQSTDENSQVTTYQYNDVWGRPTYASTPDGQVTNINYDDAGPNPSVTKSMLLNVATGATKKTETVMDGVGHMVHSYALSDPYGQVNVDTVIDGMGRVYTVTNPYRSTSDPTYGITTKTYDALGRLTQQVNPDSIGSAVSYQYSGNAVLFTDEVGNRWNRTYDAFGRLTQVLEPSPTSATPTLQTSYTYDAANDLLTVNQAGTGSSTDGPARTRSFAYDSLGRLLAALNPEATNSSGPTLSCSGANGSWSNCYSYDANGNLISKTDNRGISVNYSYDWLNRPFTKSFSMGGAATSDPLVCTQYDVPVQTASDPYAKGLTTLMWSVPSTSSCPSLNSTVTSLPANALNAKIITLHDQMGRVRNWSECPYSSSCSSPFNFTTTYDVAGSLLTSTNGLSAYPNAALGFTKAYDSEERLKQIATSSQPSAWSTSSFPTTLLQASQGTPYDPMGHMVSAQYGIASGSNPGIKLIRQYDPRGRITLESDAGYAITDAPTGSTGNITISGSEDAPVVATTAGTHGSTTLTVTGSEGTHQVCTSHTVGRQIVTTCNNVPDTGSLSVSIQGFTASANYTAGSTDATIASALASGLSESGSPVTASSNGSSLTMTSVATGTASNYSFTISNGADFSVSDSSTALTGGTNGTSQTFYDAGTITVTINGVETQINWGQGSTPSNLASALAQALQQSSGSFLQASASGSMIQLSSVQTGTSVDWGVSVSAVDSNSSQFPNASFGVSSNNMTGGTANGGGNYGTLYSYSVPTSSSSPGYAANGNLMAYSDSVMGSWSAFSYNGLNGYDDLNRLVQMQATSGPYSGLTGCWSYDSFGNRTQEILNPSGTSPCIVSPNGQSTLATFSGSGRNQVSSFTYDQAGNVTADGRNSYAYDGEGRLCAVGSNLTGQPKYTEYLYGPDGDRIAKGTVSGLSCALAGFSLTNEYLHGGESELTVSGGVATPLHTNISADNLTATYYFGGAASLHFHLSDPLGTRRVQASSSGALEMTFQSLPFGNDIGNTVQVDAIPQISGGFDATEQHYTGKERDAESGNDYFGARYYSSAMGRFLSPDWSAKVMPVPYAKLDNPQSLNLYSYVWNNPLSRNDPDGHYTAGCGGDVKNCDKQIQSLDKQLQSALKSKNPDIVKAAQAYGKLGDKNGVNVTFMKVVDPKNANVLGTTSAQAGTGGITVDQATGKVQQATQVNLQAGMGGSQLQETAVHEGVHVEDRANFINTITMTPYSFNQNLNISGRQSELNAYGVENEWRQANGMPTIDINDQLSHPPYSTNPNIDKPILPDFPGPQ